MICFVCGFLCSGKTLYAKALCEMTDGLYVEIGDIVRNRLKTNEREILQDSRALSTYIIDQLKEIVAVNGSRDIVISGARQVELLQAFPEATILWIDCPRELRKQRYLSRKREGDVQLFEQAECGDIQLGILEVRDYILKNKQ